MAWNRPSGKKVEEKGRGRQRNGRLKGLVAGAIVVLGAAVAAWWIFGSGPAPVREEADGTLKGLIKEVTPVAAPTNAPVREVVKNPPHGLKPGEWRHVKWTKPANWDQMSPGDRTRCQPTGRVIRPKWMDAKQLFKTLPDKKIQRLLNVQPGQVILGTATYDERFVKSFLKSLETPIEFADDDTPEDREMKQAVIDVRKELKEAYDRGEDIAQIMRDTEKQLHEQAAYRVKLQHEIAVYRQSGEHSEQDVKDYIDAANLILKDNGMEPLKLKQLWFHKAKIESMPKEKSK